MSRGARAREAILTMVGAADVDLIDLDPEFRNTGDPESLFPFRLDGHYNKEGNRIVAEVVARALHFRGLMAGGGQAPNQSVNQR